MFFPINNEVCLKIIDELNVIPLLEDNLSKHTQMELTAGLMKTCTKKSLKSTPFTHFFSTVVLFL